MIQKSSGGTGIFKLFKFLIFEFVTARTAINAAMGNGSLTKKQGVALLGAVTTRIDRKSTR
jgi:hypothetical protein